MPHRSCSSARSTPRARRSRTSAIACRRSASATIVADSGILGEPLDIVPDVSRAEVARLGGTTIEALRKAGSRGKAVHGMLLGLQRLALNLFRDGRLDGVLCLGGAEGAVLGASAMMALPIGVPKIIVTPIASGQRRFGPLVGTRDVMVVHSVIDILGLNPISTTIFDNVAAAMAGMLQHGHRLQARRRPAARGDHDARQHDQGRDDDSRRAGAAGPRQRDLPLERRRRSGDGGARGRRPVRRRHRLHDRRADRRARRRLSRRRSRAAAPDRPARPAAGRRARLHRLLRARPARGGAGAPAGPARLHAQSGVHARADPAGRDGAARPDLRRAAQRGDRPDRGHGADRGPVDSERAGRRVLESGRRRRLPGGAARAPARRHPVSTHPRHINAPEFALAVADRFVALLSSKGTIE